LSAAWSFNVRSRTQRKSASFKPEEFENHYHTALKELVDQKMKGRKIIAPHEEAATRRKVVDLMAA
jgi:DNA end-binding protein Ku